MRRDDTCLYPNPDDRAELPALIANRKTPCKPVWRAETLLATADGHGTLQDHATREHAEADRLALAGAVSRRGRCQAQARQDEAVARAAVAAGNPPEGDRNDGAGEPAERHPLEPLDHRRAGGDLAVERRAHMSRRGPEAATDKVLQGLQRPNV